MDTKLLSLSYTESGYLLATLKEQADDCLSLIKINLEEPNQFSTRTIQEMLAKLDIVRRLIDRLENLQKSFALEGETEND